MKRAHTLYNMVIILAVIFNASADYQIHCVEDRGAEIVLTFTASQYRVQEVLVNGEKCQYITLSEAAYLNEKGFPRLPRISQPLKVTRKAT